MEQLNICTTQTEKMKYSDKDFLSSKEKSGEKTKSKKRKSDKKRKNKKKRKYSTSSSSKESCNSDEYEWVEKTNKDQTSPYISENAINNKTQEKQLERDEWMNIESFVPCTSKFNTKKQRSDTKEENKTKMFLDKPGQSDRELNPYWKNGGNGLPQANPEKFNNQPILDVNWLRKSLRRAEEQASKDGRSLEEVAAERWGSLETIQSMIAEAERKNLVQDKLYNKYCNNKYCNNMNNKDLLKTFNLRRRKHSRSRSRSKSRSKSRERIGKYNAYDHSLQRTRQKQTYQKPKNNDDYCAQAIHKSSSNCLKNWKKNKNDKKSESVSSDNESKRTNIQNISNTNEVNESNDLGILSEAEMNKLGARVIKAELMGDEELAAQLKAQLEQARKLAATNVNVQKETIILTRTDAKGIARPVQSRSQSMQFTENRRKNKTIETHISNERIRHFTDDDKYSLHQMFQHEKGRSTNEDEAIFAKCASKTADHMDDMFEQQIAQTHSEVKRDRQERMYAIKEHKDLYKSLDNCYWCPDSKNMLKHMIVSMDDTICLSLPACTSLTISHCILTPIQHIACQLQLDEDVWEKLKELKRKLMQMFVNENLYPIFFEVYKKKYRFSHMQLECVPLPKEIGESAPIYFKKALSECETEWSVNKKIVDLKDKDIRHAIPNGLSYFMVEFASHPGYAHIIEDEGIFPTNFAKEIIGGMLDLDCNLWRKPKKQNFDEQRAKVLEFAKMWKKYNSTQLNEI